MNKEIFFKKNDEKFLGLGFQKDEQDPFFYYYMNLANSEEVQDKGFDDDDMPKLLFGNTGVNKGFCIYTGLHFVWLGCGTPEEAIKVSENIVAFEEC